MNQNNFLGIDYGTKNIGLAYKIGNDPIVPTDTLLNTDKQKTLSEICKICLEKKITQIIIGLPLNLKGEIDFQAKITKKFANKLQKKLLLPIEYSDERFTSKITNIDNSDSYSAAEILSGYLNRIKK